MLVLGFLGLVLGLLLFVGPQLWARHTLSRHADDRPDCRGTGGELAEHLVRTHGMEGVRVERIDHDGDHYDPDARAIRLSPRSFDGRSITAVTVATHEFGHALQDHQGDPGLRRRTVLVKQAFWIDRIGSGILMLSPFLIAFGPSRAMGITVLLAGIGLSLVRVIVHGLTLPVELDASFRKALPILEQGGYLPPEHMPAARNILRACALTYVAGSLISVLNLLRWIRR
ncbi:MAG: zinc metallopeptidase [Minwuia sp.]|uniref:zinc metallopeptidase n=1 Tax=Minwuia sp. TaxID=2493630 RepID=UPI003A89E55D